MLDRLGDLDPQRRAQMGLNKGEAGVGSGRVRNDTLSPKNTSAVVS